MFWETDCPEAVDLRAIYEHFRRREMTWWEWRRGLAAGGVLGPAVIAMSSRIPLRDGNSPGPLLAQIEAKLDRILLSIETLASPKSTVDPSGLAAAGHALTKQEVARRFQVSTRTLDRWRSMGFDLGELTIGRTTRFDPAKIAHIISTQKVKRRSRP